MRLSAVQAEPSKLEAKCSFPPQDLRSLSNQSFSSTSTSMDPIEVYVELVEHNSCPWPCNRCGAWFEEASIGQIFVVSKTDDSSPTGSYSFSTAEADVFFRGWLGLLFCCGFLDFAAIPVSYALAFRFGAVATLPIAVAKGVVSTCAQKFMVTQLLKEMIRFPPHCHTVVQSVKEFWHPWVGPGKLCMCSIRQWLVTAILFLPESVDSVNDAGVAGFASRVISSEMVSAFRNQWIGKLLGIGDKIAALGLPGSLRTILLWATIGQTIVFVLCFISGLYLISKSLHSFVNRRALYWNMVGSDGEYENILWDSERELVQQRQGRTNDCEFHDEFDGEFGVCNPIGMFTSCDSTLQSMSLQDHTPEVLKMQFLQGISFLACASSTSSMCLVSCVLERIVKQELRMTALKRPVIISIERGRPLSVHNVSLATAFTKGLMENALTIWIQASMLGISLALQTVDRLSILVNVLSILTSFVALFSSMPGVFSATRTAFVNLCACDHFLQLQWFRAILHIVLDSLVGVFGVTYFGAVVATAIHYIGITVCPQHNFEFSEMGCTTWNATIHLS